MRQMSLSSLQSMFAEDTQSIYLTLLEVDHSTLSNPLLFCNNNEDIIHQGNVYQWFPFKIGLPADSEEQVKVQLTIDNVNQQIIQLLREIKTKPTITIKVVVLEPSEQDPPETDVVEVGPVEMKLKQYDANAQIITGTIAYDEDFLNQSFPRHSFTPQSAPGMFE